MKNYLDSDVGNSILSWDTFSWLPPTPRKINNSWETLAAQLTTKCRILLRFFFNFMVNQDCHDLKVKILCFFKQIDELLLGRFTDKQNFWSCRKLKKEQKNYDIKRTFHGMFVQPSVAWYTTKANTIKPRKWKVFQYLILPPTFSCHWY